jgi:hypothetical protein
MIYVRVRCFFRSKKTQGHNKYSQSELMLPMPEKERKKERKEKIKKGPKLC